MNAIGTRAHRGTRDSNAPGTGRLGPVLARLVLAFIALAGIYLVVANLSLVPGIRSLARSMGVTAQVASAYTLYPTQLHVEGLRLTGRHGAAWTVRLTEADLRVDLVDLVGGRVHIKHLRGGGMEVELGGLRAELVRASEVMTGAVVPLVRAALPPPGRPAAPGGRRERALLIEDIEVGARAIGVGPYRLVGAMSARSARLAASSATLEVDAGELDIVDGEIHRDARLVARAVHGRVDARIHPTDASALGAGFTDADARDPLRAAGGRVELAGELVSLEALLPLEAATVEGGQGSLKAGISLDHGVIAQGSEVRVVAGPLSVRLSDKATNLLPAGLVMTASRTSAEQPLLKLEVSVPELRQQPPDAQGAHESVEGVHVELETLSADLTTPWTRSGALRASAARGFWRAGAATLAGGAKARFDLEELELRAGTAQIKAGILEAVSVVVSPLETGHGRDRPHATMQGTLRIDGGALSIRDGASLHGSISAGGADAGALLDLLGVTGTLRWTLEILDRRPFALSSALVRRPPQLLLDEVRFESGDIEARGAFQTDSDGRAGAFLVTTGQLSAGLSIQGDQLHVIASPGEDWLARRVDAITGR
ncbi:hypothetical protein WMF11_28905 [Sorangium sp. So ce295]|uniref:hypothetical protein n=1 Tax=Sorangium sp. So ce295 TaxID=3133295 RepID=UPI003F60F444